MNYVKQHGCIALFTVLFSLFASGTARAQEAYIFTSFHEPSTDGLRYLYSYDGLQWDSIPGVWMHPEIGNDHAYVDAFSGELVLPTFAPDDRVLRDPSIVQGPDGTFHLVWTTQWMGSRGFGYARSKDLIHWSKQVEIPVMQNHPTNNVWAPEVFYDDELKLYFIIWSSSVNPKDYTHADKLGTNSCHRMWYCTTKDWKRFSEARPYYDPGFNSIDGFLLKRASKDYVLIVKDNRKPGFSNLFCAFSDSPYGPFRSDFPTAGIDTSSSLPEANGGKGLPSAWHGVFGRTFSEGPCAVRLNNKGKDEWIIYYDQYHPQEFGAVSTTDFKTFTPIPKRIKVPAEHKHGTIVKVSQEILNNLLKAAKAGK